MLTDEKTVDTLTNADVNEFSIGSKSKVEVVSDFLAPHMYTHIVEQYLVYYGVDIVNTDEERLKMIFFELAKVYMTAEDRRRGFVHCMDKATISRLLDDPDFLLSFYAAHERVNIKYRQRSVK